MPNYIRVKDFHHLHGVLHRKNHYYGTAFFNSDTKTLCLLYTSSRVLGHWELDIRFKQTKPTMLRYNPVGVGKDIGDEIRIHSGMNEIFEHIIAETRRIVRQLEPKRIVISGHSLGAALSTLVAMDLAASPTCKAILYNYVFASPRVGNKVFVKLFHVSKNPIRHFRISNTEDVIVNLPPPNIAVCCLRARYAHTKQVTIAFTKTKKTATISHSNAYNEFIYNDKAIVLKSRNEIFHPATVAETTLVYTETMIEEEDDENNADNTVAL